MKKNRQQPRLLDRQRLVFISLGILCLFSLLIVQFYKIQIVEEERWTKVAHRQHYFTINEPFKRGTFFSNTAIKRGHPEVLQHFVTDIQKFHLFVDSQSVVEEHRDAIAEYLWGVVGDNEHSYEEFRSEFDKHSRSRNLARCLDGELRDRIREWWFPFARKRKIAPNALFFISDYQRSYPFGKLLGQVLHTVQRRKDEVTKQSLPTGGLELSLNKYLKGSLGKRRLMRSPRHTMEMGEVIQSPEDGADIHLSINLYLQAIVEEELARGVKKAQAKGGWAVMMDPVTGEILALAQYPFFYPERYEEYFNDEELKKQTKVQAVTDAHEPGSVMKPITLAVALKANEELLHKGGAPLFSPTEKVATANGRFPGRRRPIQDSRVHNYLNMYLALQKSSNIYMARMIQRVVGSLGNEWYRQELCETFGFGTKTGIELPAESAGVVPTPGKLHANGTLEWSVPTPFSMAFGHNIQVNAIQLVRAYAILANGGFLVEPTLVRKVEKQGEVLIDHTRPERIHAFKRVLSEDVVDEVVTAMKAVTKWGGSGRRANIPGYTEAGKTGTARKIINGQYTKSKHVSSFIGFAPIKQPAFVLLVSMDEPANIYLTGVGHNVSGSVCAAPVFREIASKVLEYLGVAPDDPDNRHWEEERKKLAALYKKWNEPAKKVKKK